ncbi:MAG: TM0106 family RecB-like putative nuclease [Microcoleaceae cyanobacterium]
MLITDTQLLFYQRCPRRAFLDYYGDFQQQQPTSDFLRKLTQDSVAHRRSLLAEMTYHRPQYPRADWEAGMNATLELMKQGVDRICQGVLLWQPPDLQQIHITDQLGTITLKSCPDLLVKQPGTSQFGDWMYVPVEIKLGKRPKLEYQIGVTFHAYVLGAIQGVVPAQAELILRQKGSYFVNLKQRLPQMQQVLLEYIDMLAYREEPEVFMARQKCSLCTWYDSCYAIAQSQNHLSLLPGVTPSRYTRLQTLNLTTLEDLAQTPLDQLESYPEFDAEVAQQLIQQAQVSWQNQPRLRPGVSSTGLNLSGLNLPENAPVELYFDIEAQPDLNLDYLHGVLVVDYRNQTETFHPFFAENKAEEERTWQQFLELVWSYPISPIYHFCDYEAKTVKRLAKLYQTPTYLWLPLLNRFVDIHHQVTQTVFLPVESYALKSIARSLGFEWRDTGANGAQSVCWYEQWLKSGDRSRIDAIMQYNEDDCRATYHVKNWLTQFLRQSQF